MEINNKVKDDFEKYKQYVTHRSYIFSIEELNEIQEIYEELYLFSEIIVNYQILDRKSMIREFINECKNALIISYDLLNMNYLNASKQVFRGSIESFFRFSLAFSRYETYKSNCSKGNYGVTEELKNLKTLYTCQKVYKLTSGTIEYFKDIPVVTCFSELNNIYSELSSSVHVNSTDDFSPQKYLIEYTKINIEETRKVCQKVKRILNNYLLILVYFESKMNFNGISKRNMQLFETFLNSADSLILEKIENYSNIVIS